jgi:DNA polymerase-3 subunit gamma/tau
MGKALYRKHRPRKLAEVVGQEHITQTLSRALSSGKLSHAYLFTGPKGTGKTSIARILAHEINQLPYADESIHLDIIEIDAASNRRIDEIRDLKDRIHIAPTSAKYKVYIIDEVHMLTREAFNALLKTLEEPPEHVVFILATTEAHKLPETIISRTQRFGFRPIDQSAVIDHLKSLAKAEKIAITDEALGLIADHGNGSFRDSIALLDQMRSTADNITADDVHAALGYAPKAIVEAIVGALQKHDSKQLAEAVQRASSQAVQPAQLAQQLSAVIREQFVTAPTEQLSKLLRDLQTVHGAHNDRVALDLALFGSIATLSPQPTATVSHATTPEAMRPQQVAREQAQEPTNSSKPGEPAKQPKPPKPQKSHESPQKPITADRPEDTKQPSTPTETAESTDPPTAGDWQDILQAIKGKHNTLYGIVRMAEPMFEPGSIVLGFQFPFHHKRVSEARYIDILNTVAMDVVGHAVRVSCKVIPKQSDQTTAATKSLQPTPEPDLSALSDVFGDGISVDDA